MTDPQAGEPIHTSSLDGLLLSSAKENETLHSRHLLNLASTIIYNLRYQHDWNSISLHTISTLTGLPLPRPLISGLPPKRVYVHPDEQVEILKAEHDSGSQIIQHAEREWVLPTHLSEKWSLKQFSEVFDAIETVPGGERSIVDAEEYSEVGDNWRGDKRQKRVLLATLHDDSTVVYYIMHDGIIKPRQN
jgi:tRNA-splicing endonuclease subunit Sen15